MQTATQETQIVTLNEYISFSIHEVEARRKAAEKDKAIQAERLKALIHSAISGAIERMDHLVPAPLRPYITYAGQEPTSYPCPWQPVDFAIKAPSLVTINFRVRWAEGDSKAEALAGDFIEAIWIRLDQYGHDWTQAIADAARWYQEMEDAAKECF